MSNTSLEIETVDRALVRRYTQMFRFGQFDRPYEPGEIDAEAHGAETRRIGSQIAVLLKNDGALPLDAHAGSVVMIGQSAFVDEASLGGGESSKVTPLYTVPPLNGMRPFGVWDYCTRSFAAVSGDHTVYVGTSADETPHTVLSPVPEYGASVRVSCVKVLSRSPAHGTVREPENDPNAQPQRPRRPSRSSHPRRYRPPLENPQV